MNIEKHRAFIDSLEGEKGLPEEMHGWRFDEKLQPFDRTMFYEDGIIKSSTVEYLIERLRRAESRQIPDLQARHIERKQYTENELYDIWLKAPGSETGDDPVSWDGALWAAKFRGALKAEP